MGMYASATLFYGYIFDDDDIEVPVDENGDEIEEFDLAEKRLKASGIVDPWDSYPENTEEFLNYDEQRAANAAWHAEHSEEIDEWFKAKAVIERTINVEMSSYGHYDENHLCLVVKNTLQGASPSYPRALDDLWTDPKWERDLDEFLMEYDITPPEDGPCWWLVASYG